jgi:hypothetical protein
MYEVWVSRDDFGHVDDARAKQNVNTHKIYWGTHNMINWVLEKNLQVAA